MIQSPDSTWKYTNNILDYFRQTIERFFVGSEVLKHPMAESWRWCHQNLGGSVQVDNDAAFDSIIRLEDNTPFIIKLHSKANYPPPEGITKFGSAVSFNISLETLKSRLRSRSHLGKYLRHISHNEDYGLYTKSSEKSYFTTDQLEEEAEMFLQLKQQYPTLTNQGIVDKMNSITGLERKISAVEMNVGSMKKRQQAKAKKDAKLQVERDLVAKWDRLYDQGMTNKTAAEKLGKTLAAMKGMKTKVNKN
jgi:hypothetical protein